MSNNRLKFKSGKKEIEGPATLVFILGLTCILAPTIVSIIALLQHREIIEVVKSILLFLKA